jgi:immune inhibitor A
MMNHFKSLTAIALYSAIPVLFATTAFAVMPPAPPEWYERINMPVPEGIRLGLYPNTEDIEKDLAQAAQKRRNNTDNLLLILVEFTDNPADQVSHPPEAYDDIMFSSGVIPTGSLVEYYQEISYGAFTPAGTVTVWITAPHPYTYYSDGNYGTGSYPNNSQGLLEDCVNMLDLTIDFSQFDNNGDGYAEGIFLVHAGPGAEETGDPDDIWSHAWYYEVETDDGTLTGRYSVEPEEHYDGSMIAIGVYCHEYGHVLGMPDLYDTDGSSEGVGVYCLMASGSWGALPGNPERPTHMSAEMKRRLGWLTPTEVTGNLIDLVIPPVETVPICYQIYNDSDPDEYFLIENRAKIGFDSLFRGDGGLAIWHVDWDGWQSDETHRYVALEQADGNGDLERDHGTGNRHPRTNRGDAGDLYPGATNNTYFSFSSDPSSRSYASTGGFATIDDISHHGDSMIVDVYKTPDVPIYRIWWIQVSDDIEGYSSNNNNEADSGEVVDLLVGLHCDGEGASTVEGTIATADPRVEIVDASADYLASTHNQTTHNYSSQYRIRVLSGSVDSAVTFQLHINADGKFYDTEFGMNINRQKIAIVIDNNASHWSDNLVEAMTRSGYSFDTLWNSDASSNNRIEYDDLIPYHAVLWTTGSYFGRRTSSPDYEDCISNSELAVIQEYLDNNGRLGLFSQDYLYDRGIDAFAMNYLYVAGTQEDEGSTRITGVTGTFSQGFDGLVSEWTHYDYTDFLTPRSGAQSVMMDDPSGDIVMINYPPSPAIGAPVTSFGSFSIERLDDTSLTSFLNLWCEWILTNTNIDVPIPALPRNYDTLTEAAPVFMWTESPGATSYHIQIATEFEFTNIVRETSVPGNSTAFAQPFEEGIYYWRVNASADGRNTTAYGPRSMFAMLMTYICGDANSDGEVNVGDGVFVINYVFKEGPAPTPLCQGDANGDDEVNVGDAVYVINYVFNSGPPPLEPCCP